MYVKKRLHSQCLKNLFGDLCHYNTRLKNMFFPPRPLLREVKTAASGKKRRGEEPGEPEGVDAIPAKKRKAKAKAKK